MKSLYFLFFIILGISNNSFAQKDKNYIQILKGNTLTTSKDSIRYIIFPGEIYLGTKEKDFARLICIGSIDSVRLDHTSTPYTIMNNGSDLSDLKRNFKKNINEKQHLIKKIVINNKDKYEIDISRIRNDHDTITFASYTKPIHFVTKDTDILGISSFRDKYIRLIIPGIPTIFIDTAEIITVEARFTNQYLKENFTLLYSKQYGEIYAIDPVSKFVYEYDENKMAYGNYATRYKQPEIVYLKNEKKLVVRNGKGMIEDVKKDYTWYIIIGAFAFLFVVYIIFKVFGIDLIKITYYISTGKLRNQEKQHKQYISHKIGNKDTIKKLAKKYNVTIDDIIYNNKFKDYFEASLKKSKPHQDFFIRGNLKYRDTTVLKIPIKKYKSDTETKKSNKFETGEKSNQIQSFDENNKEDIKKVFEFVMKSTNQALMNSMNKYLNMLGNKTSDEILKFSEDGNDKEQSKSEYRNSFEKNIKLNEQINELQITNEEILKEYEKIEDLAFFLSNNKSFLTPNRSLLISLKKAEGKVMELRKRSFLHDPFSKESLYLMHFISKFLTKKPSKELYRWDSIIEIIEENGIIIDKDLCSMCKRENTDEIRIKNLNESIYYNIYRNYISTIIILLEETRNLENFINKESNITKEAKEIQHEIESLKNSMKHNLEFEINYVPLFCDYRQYSDIIEAKHDNLSPLYQHIELEQDHILQIKSYGLVSKYGSEKTLVILKQ